MKRMTKIFRNSQMQPDVELLGTISDGIFRLAEYEDAEENGLIVRLPCPIGTPIYHIGLEIPEDEEQCFECRDNHSGFGDFYCDNDFLGWPSMEDRLNNPTDVCPKFKPYLYLREFTLSFYASYQKWFGVTWFITQEEAEAKLTEFATQND